MNTRQQHRTPIQQDKSLLHLAHFILQTANLEHLNLAAKLAISLVTTTAASLVAVHEQYERQRVRKQVSKWNVVGRLRYTIFSTFNIQSSISFAYKVFLDNLALFFKIDLNDYFKGAIVGVFSYWRNTPIKYVRQTQQTLRGRNRQPITYQQAYSFLRQTYGESRLYPGHFSVNRANSGLFFMLYFGVYGSLNHQMQNKLSYYLINPLLASVVAMGPTLLVSRIGNMMYSIHQMRVQIARSMGRRLMLFRTTVVQELLKRKTYLFKLTPAQKHMQTRQLISNWLLLMFFVAGQNAIYPELCKNGFISEDVVQ